jgi:hypothetical protein
VKSINYEAPQYVIFPVLLILPLGNLSALSSRLPAAQYMCGHHMASDRDPMVIALISTINTALLHVITVKNVTSLSIHCHASLLMRLITNAS